MPSSDYTPDVADVALFLRTRTRDTNGVELGTFSSATRPTADEVSALIADSVVNLEDDLGTDIDERLWSSAKRVVALRTAMAVEVSYFSEQVAANRSVYPQLEEWYKEDLDKLGANIVETAEGGDLGSDAGENTPVWGGGDYPFLDSDSFLSPGGPNLEAPFSEALGIFHKDNDAVGSIDDLPSTTPNSGTVTAYLRKIRDLLSGALRTIDGTGYVDNDGTSRQVKHARIDTGVIGDNTILAAVTDRKIRVHSVFLVSSGVTTARFESGAGGSPLTGQMSLVANSGFVLPHNPHGWFETDIDVLLNLELSAGVSVDGALTYTEVT